jgi:predicted Zn-dependent protease
MNRTLLAGLAGLAILAACSDIVSPLRNQRYDWRLIVTYDSAGPRVDTLSFHWPRNQVPVKMWVEDASDLKARAREGIALWKDAFLYGEWDARLVDDSASADVIVRLLQPPPLRAGAIRMAASVEPCFGATDVDTGTTRHEIVLPIRSYVFPSLPNDPGLEDCMRHVTSHEIGHTMGLFQHSTDSLDLMYGVPAVDFLSERDAGTAENAYHFKPDMVPVRP